MYSELITKAVLENCLRVTIRQIPKSRTLSIGLFINHAVKDEEVEVNGISHFIEHILFNHRNMTLQGRELLGDLMDNGALYEAFTGKEMTRCTLSAQRSHFPEMIGALSQIIMNCNSVPENVEHERAIILQEAETYFSSGRIKDELIEQALWGTRSIGLFVIGDRRNISSFRCDELQQRFGSYYTPRNTHLIVQGDIGTDEVMNQVEDAFHGWDQSGQQKDIYVEEEPNILGIGNNQRVDLTIAFLGASFHSNERHAMYLLSDILGRGLKSRLFAELREKRELVYTIYSSTQSYALSGYLSINVNCQRDKLTEVYRCILDILEDIKTNGVTEEELRRAKAARTTALLQVPGDAAKHLHVTGRYALLGKDFFVDLEVFEIRAVTCGDLRSLAQSMFQEDRMALSAVGSSSEELSMLI